MLIISSKNNSIRRLTQSYIYEIRFNHLCDLPVDFELYNDLSGSPYILLTEYRGLFNVKVEQIA